MRCTMGFSSPRVRTRALRWRRSTRFYSVVRALEARELMSSFGPYEPWTTQPYSGQLGTAFADVDGARKADAIVVNPDKITVRRSTGSAFGAYEPWTGQSYYGQLGTAFADVDGDGKADAIVVNKDRITVRRS